MNSCHRKLATTGACGRQHKGVVSLVLAGATPRLVVRRQERLRHSAEIIQYAELAERCPMTTRHLVTRVKQQRLPDSYKSQTCDLKLPNRRMAPCTKVPPRHERSTRSFFSFFLFFFLFYFSLVFFSFFHFFIFSLFSLFFLFFFSFFSFVFPLFSFVVLEQTMALQDSDESAREAHEVFFFLVSFFFSFFFVSFFHVFMVFLFFLCFPRFPCFFYMFSFFSTSFPFFLFVFPSFFCSCFFPFVLLFPHVFKNRFSVFVHLFSPLFSLVFHFFSLFPFSLVYSPFSHLFHYFFTFFVTLFRPFFSVFFHPFFVFFFLFPPFSFFFIFSFFFLSFAGRTCLMFFVIPRCMMSTWPWSRPETNVCLETTCRHTVTFASKVCCDRTLFKAKFLLQLVLSTLLAEPETHNALVVVVCSVERSTAGHTAYHGT